MIDFLRDIAGIVVIGGLILWFAWRGRSRGGRGERLKPTWPWPKGGDDAS